MLNIDSVILEKLQADPKWSSRLEASKTWDEVVKVKNFWRGLFEEEDACS